MARQFFLQVGICIRLSKNGDAFHGDILDEHMGSFKNQCRRGCVGFCGIQKSDGAAIAVAEKNWIASADALEQFRQHYFAFVVHEFHRA